MRRVVLALALSLAGALAFTVPAGATVHEITGMFCAGDHGNHFPPGLSGGSKGNNFAKPLFVTGFVESVDPNYVGTEGPGPLITFDFDHPASKLAPHPTLDVFFFADEGVYVSAFVLDTDHPFANCVLLRTS